jgi:hypothetical protein
MANIKFGLTSWDEVEVKSGGFARSADAYMRLESGSNVVRCVTKPHQYLVHSYKEEGDPGYGDKVYCSSFHKSCPLCEEGNKPKRRWLVGIIDRKTQTYKVLDISITVFKAIQELSRDEDYGNPEKYDIDIKVDKQGGATGYYNVIPKPAKPMTANDLDLKSKIDHDELLRKCTPPTPEKVAERLESLKAKKSGKPQTKPQVRPGRTAPVAQVDMHGSSDEDFTFQAVDDNN